MKMSSLNSREESTVSLLPSFSLPIHHFSHPSLPQTCAYLPGLLCSCPPSLPYWLTPSHLMSPAPVCTTLQTNVKHITDVAAASIRNASSIVAKDMLGYYNGSDLGQIPGLFPEPYYWWESAAVWGSLIDYWNYTGDAQYVGLVQQALLWQVGPDNDYMTPNQTKTEVGLSSFLGSIGQHRLTAMVRRQTMIKRSGP